MVASFKQHPSIGKSPHITDFPLIVPLLRANLSAREPIGPFPEKVERPCSGQKWRPWECDSGVSLKLRSSLAFSASGCACGRPRWRRTTQVLLGMRYAHTLHRPVVANCAEILPIGDLGVGVMGGEVGGWC